MFQELESKFITRKSWFQSLQYVRTCVVVGTSSTNPGKKAFVRCVSKQHYSRCLAGRYRRRRTVGLSVRRRETGLDSATCACIPQFRVTEYFAFLSSSALARINMLLCFYFFCKMQVICERELAI